VSVHSLRIGLVAGAAMVACAPAESARPEPRTTKIATRGAGAAAMAIEASAARIAERADALRGRCAEDMVEIEGRFCIDRWEASLVDVLPSGEERPHSPFTTVDGRRVRAVSKENVYPQGYISAIEAMRACNASQKRLCTIGEWKKACRGPERRVYGYADRREPGRCNDRGRSPVIALFGRRFTSSTMNQPVLNQLEGTLSKTGAHAGCTNGYGVFDMVGNLHEWVADPGGTFVGGYYQDVASIGHGEGCEYTTTAHEARYHDYSTGFRCCSDIPRAR
jgi:hypothetical protein